MEIEEKEIPIGQLKLGMYVSRLDIPWEITSFPIQGLLIETQQDIDRLSSSCKTVFIDQARSSRAYKVKHAIISSSPQKHVLENKAAARKKSLDWKKRHCVEIYKVSVPMQKEMHRSVEIFNALERQLYLICEHTLRCRKAHVQQIIESTTQVVESIVRNPDAMAWLCRVRVTRKPIYMHTMRLAVWGAIVGRQLGLNVFSINHLCFALLMTGIGKSHVSQSALEGYSPRKSSVAYQQHLQETLYQLEQFRLSSDDVGVTLKHYCERFDGSGFPRGLRADAIPFFSRICGLIETFELLINPYDSACAVSPANAIVYLNKSKDLLFDAGLVEEFVQAIGIYPTGTLVKLSNNQLGVIFTQNYEKRLRASVIPIVDSQGNVIPKLKIMDLTYENESQHASGRVFIQKGVPSTSIPRGLLDNAHQWMFNQDSKFVSWLKSMR